MAGRSRIGLDRALDLGIRLDQLAHEPDELLVGERDLALLGPHERGQQVLARVRARVVEDLADHLLELEDVALHLEPALFRR